MLEQYEIPIHYMYIYSWHFVYTKKFSSILGQNVDVGWQNPWRALEKYAGLYFAGVNGLALTTNQSNGHYTMGIINCNSYDAFWTGLYKKVKLQHFCAFELSDNSKIKIYEPMQEKYTIETLLEKFKSIRYRFLFPSLFEKTHARKEDLLNSIAPNKLAKNSNYTKSLTDFINDLRGYFIRGKVDGYDSTLIQIDNHKNSLMNVHRVIRWINPPNKDNLLSILEEASSLWTNYIRFIMDCSINDHEDSFLSKILYLEKHAVTEYEKMRLKL